MAAANFIKQLNTLLVGQQGIMGDQFPSMLDAQFEAAKRSIAQQQITMDEAAAVVQAVHDGPWTAAQKQDLGKAINDRLAQPGKKGTKRENQEVANFYGFLTKEDKAALQEDGPLHTRLSHAADIMASMLCFWPSEQTVGHIVNTVKALRASGLESPDDYHGAVQKLKSLVKSRLRKAPKDVDFIRRYTAPHELPESVRHLFDGAEGGELASSATASSGPLRGTNKTLSTLAKTPKGASMNILPALMQDPAALNMMAYMRYFQDAQNNFNQGGFGGQQQMLPGFKLLGGRAQQNGASQQQVVAAGAAQPHGAGQQWQQAASSVSSGLQAAPAAPAEANGSVALQVNQPSIPSLADASQGANMKANGSAGQLHEPEQPLSAVQQAESMLAAWECNGNRSGASGSKDTKPKKKPAAAKPFKKPAMVVKSHEKADAKTKDKKIPTKDKTTIDLSNMKLRLRLRPHGCAKCRNRPGCCPSCFKK